MFPKVSVRGSKYLQVTSSVLTYWVGARQFSSDDQWLGEVGHSWSVHRCGGLQAGQHLLGWWWWGGRWLPHRLLHCCLNHLCHSLLKQSIWSSDQNNQHLKWSRGLGCLWVRSYQFEYQLFKSSVRCSNTWIIDTSILLWCIDYLC